MQQQWGHYAGSTGVLNQSISGRLYLHREIIALENLDWGDDLPYYRQSGAGEAVDSSQDSNPGR